MSLFRKKKKKKEKKPFTLQRFVNIFMPFLMIGIIVFSGYQAFSGCGDIFNSYTAIVNELKQDFDKTSFLDGNIIIASDKQTLNEKIGPMGIDIPIYIQGEISINAYLALNIFDVPSSFTLTDCEFGSFCDTYVTSSLDNVLNYYKLDIVSGENGTFNCVSVVKVDIEILEEKLGAQLDDFKDIYIKSDSVLDVVNGRIVVVSANSQINDLSDENNETLVDIVNMLFAQEKGAGVGLVADIANELATKTATTITLSNHGITFNI